MCEVERERERDGSSRDQRREWRETEESKS